MTLKREYKKALSHHTSLKIGGPVFCWLEAQDINDVLEAASIAEEQKKTLAVIGKGSNILAQDKGFDGIAINLGKGFDYIERQGDEIIMAGSGASLPGLVATSAELGLAGCEFLSGIPGSFGGAIFMNAGVRDVNNAGTIREIKDIVLDVDVMDFRDKKRKTLKNADINFSYRSSGLDERCILGARIKLKKDERDAIINRIDSYMKKREWIQRLGFPSAGSIFKNPDRANPAGKLIEGCGLKGERIGGAEISDIHANFIVNVGGATSTDVLGLVKLAKRSVKEKFNIDLELELKII
ncbi:UDP-N-acetylmuramate dehydrogenase [Candidatus Omnitrophota bacterium]